RKMLAVGSLSALMSTERTPLAGGPTVTFSDHGWAPSSPRLSATPPLLGRRRLRLIFSSDHLLPRCWSSTTRFPFCRPIPFRLYPASSVRLRLSSQSSPARMPACAESAGAAGAGAPPAVGGVTGIWRGNVAGSPASFLEATPVASGLAVSPAETET